MILVDKGMVISVKAATLFSSLLPRFSVGCNVCTRITRLFLSRLVLKDTGISISSVYAGIVMVYVPALMRVLKRIESAVVPILAFLSSGNLYEKRDSNGNREPEVLGELR